MTPTEIIATRLLGWEPYRPSANYEHCRCYRKGRQWEGIRIADGSRYCENDNWPDLTNWNDIRRMEDAIAEKGLMEKYVDCLIKDGQEVYALEIVSRATAAQRVAACVKVLREVQG